MLKIALCVIVRLENKYIKEYVDYYKGLGFDKIFIYDNNRPHEEKTVNELQNYVYNGFVEIIQWPIFEGNAQKPAYQDCFNRHNSEYDWMAFFDADEYFTPCNCSNIKDFLNNSLYNDFNGVGIPFKNFDDNDILINNTKKRLNKYTRPIEPDYRRCYKTIVKCNITNIDFLSTISDGCHLPYIDGGKICDADGTEIPWNEIHCDRDIKNAYLKHIPTGCIDDFINGKDLRGWPDKNNSMTFGLEYFGYFNSLTQEKIDYYNKIKKASN